MPIRGTRYDVTHSTIVKITCSKTAVRMVLSIIVILIEFTVEISRLTIDAAARLWNDKMRDLIYFYMLPVSCNYSPTSVCHFTSDSTFPCDGFVKLFRRLIKKLRSLCWHHIWIIHGHLLMTVVIILIRIFMISILMMMLTFARILFRAIVIFCAIIIIQTASFRVLIL